MLKELIGIVVLIGATLQNGETEEFFKPIMYGTSIALVAISFAIIAFMYSLTYEKDPMIYSKYLTVKKNK